MLWPLSVVLVANTNGRLAIPALAGLLVYFGTPLISPKLIELESRNWVCWQAFVGIMATYKNLTAIWGDRQRPLFILGLPPYIRN